MKTKIRTAEQIDMPALRLADTPLAPSTNATRAGIDLALLQSAQIGDKGGGPRFSLNRDRRRCRAG